LLTVEQKERGVTMIGLVGAQRAAEFLGIKLSTLYCWCEQERLPHIRLGRTLRFDLNALREWIDLRRVAPREA
jgi:excisionase family DNA binding protein